MIEIGIALVCFSAGWLFRYFTSRRECASCFNKFLQKREWERTAYLDPGWNVLPRTPCPPIPMPPVKPPRRKDWDW